MAMAPNLRRYGAQMSMHICTHTATYCCPAARKQVQAVQNLLHVLRQFGIEELVDAMHQCLGRRSEQQAVC